MRPSQTSLLILIPRLCKNKFILVFYRKQTSGLQQKNLIMDRSNRYLLAARLVAAIHLFFTLFALFGGILVCFAKWVAWIHIPVAIWGTYAFLASKICPLTPFEKRLLQKAGEEITEDGFVEGFMPFLKKWIESPRLREFLIGGLFLVWNIIVYLFLWSRSFIFS